MATPRDGYVEAAEALVKARQAHAEGKKALTRSLVAEIADAAASTGRSGLTWKEVLATPFGDDRMPNNYALELGAHAMYLGEDTDEDLVLADFDDLERRFWQAVDEAGPGDDYRLSLQTILRDGKPTQALLAVEADRESWLQLEAEATSCLIQSVEETADALATAAGSLKDVAEHARAVRMASREADREFIRSMRESQAIYAHD